MTQKKTLVVVGATGNQGGSVIQALLKDETFSSGFQIKGVTRNVESDASQALVKKGIEMVKADVNKKEELIEAFKDAYAVFAVTNFWDKEILMNDHSIEEKQGKLIADACLENKVKHVIWSTLHNVEKVSGGKYDKVVHFDGKARVEDYMREKNLPATFVAIGFYASNFMTYMPPHKNAEGVLEFTLPCNTDTVVPVVDANVDFGPTVVGILKAGPEATHHKNVNIAGEYISFGEVAKVFEKVTGKPTVFKSVPREAYLAAVTPFMGPVVGEEFTQMLEYFKDFGYYGGESLNAQTYHGGKMSTFESWLKSSGWTGPQ